MKTYQRQAGMSLVGMLLIALMVGFFIMCAIRMGPPYFEHLSVRSIIEQIAMDPETQDLSISSIRRNVETNFNTNQIYGLDPRSVEIYRKKGKTYIDSSYEVRVPLVWRIEGVIAFNDLLYRVGEPDPIDPAEVASKKK